MNDQTPDFKEPVRGPWDPFDASKKMELHGDPGSPTAPPGKAMLIKYIQYIHHGIATWVRSDRKGHHRDICMCYDCALFQPGTPEENCPIANLLFGVCLETGIVAPVYECPEFVEGARYPFKAETSLP